MKCRHAREMCYMMAHVTPQQSFSSVSPVFEIKGAGVRGALDITFWSCRAPDLKGRHIDKCSVPTNLANVFNTMHLKTFEMLVNDISMRSSPLVPGVLWSLGCEKPAISRSSSLSLGRTNVFLIHEVVGSCHILRSTLLKLQRKKKKQVLQKQRSPADRIKIKALGA